MRTTLYVNESLIESLKKITGNMNKTEIINQALEEYLAKLKREELKRAFGKIRIDLDVREYRNRDIHG
jgi:hypothetical protein